MEAIVQLEHAYFLLKMGSGNRLACIDWAIDRLQRDEEDGDLEIVLLAAATEHEDVTPLVEKIIERYCGENVLDDQLAAGKYIASLRKDYLEGRETIESLDAKINKIYYRLGYPTWLVMLTRLVVCELTVGGNGDRFRPAMM